MTNLSNDDRSLPEWIKSHDCSVDDKDGRYSIECPIRQALLIAWETLVFLQENYPTVWVAESMRRIEEIGK